jgi:hypothetical protein
MLLVLLTSSGIFAIIGIGWDDTIGALGLAWFSFSEGKEANGKSRVNKADNSAQQQ